MCTGFCSDLSRQALLPVCFSQLFASAARSTIDKPDRQEACATLHPLVIRAAASLRRHPGDDFVGVGDVAGLAMHAVGRVDLQARLAFFLHHFIDGGGAKILAGISVLGDALRRAHVQIGDDEVAGLVLFVPRAGMIDVG